MQNAQEQLTVAEQIAVAKSVSDKVFGAAKDSFPQNHAENVNLLVRIVGTVKKGEDTTTLNWPKAKWDLLAAIALSNMNEATRDKIGKQYMELMAEAETAEAKEELADRQKKVKEEADLWTRTIMQKTKVVRKGTMTFKGGLELVTEPKGDELTA